MAITVARDDVKRKCQISDTSQDSAIDALIAEMVPALEGSLAREALASADTRVQAAIKLGVTELVCSELLAQRAREPGFGEEFQVGGIRVGQFWERGRQLAEQGNARLAPFRRASSTAELENPVRAAGVNTPRRMPYESGDSW